MAETIFYHRAKRAIETGLRNPFDLTGFIPSWLNESSKSGAVEQIDKNYSHGGGWRDFNGFTLKGEIDSEVGPLLLYPGDPPTAAVCHWKVGDEQVVLFDHAWVAVVQPDGSHRIARID